MEAPYILEMNIFVVAFVIYWDAESFCYPARMIYYSSIFVSYIKCLK